MPTEADEVFREYNRYTGDGLPGEPVDAPLPIGDPASGIKSLKKAEIRDWANGFQSLVDVGGNMEEVRAAKIAAGDYATSAAAASVATAADRVQTGLDAAAAEAAKDAAALIATAVGAYSAATLTAAIAQGVAALAVGDSFSASADDVDYIGLYRINTGPVAVEIARLPTTDRLPETGVDFASPGDEVAFVETDGAGRRLRALDIDGFPVVPTVQDFHTPTDPATVEVLTGDGYQIEAFAANGSAARAIDDSAPLMPIVSGTSLLALGAGGVTTTVADLGGFTAQSIAPRSDKSVRAVLNWPLIGAYRTVAAGPAGRGFMVPDDPKVLHVIIGLGQSLSLGVGSAGTLMDNVTPYPDEALMFALNGRTADVRMGIQTGSGTLETVNAADLVGFTPMKAVNFQGIRGQTILESAVFATVGLARSLGVKMRVLGFVAGRSDTAYTDLKKGSTAYSNMITAVTKAKALAEAQGWKLCVLGALVKHGESDSGSTTYAAALTEWQLDVETDIRAITGQQGPVPFVVAPPSSFMSTSDSPNPSSARAARAMLDAHNANPKINISSPDYRWSEYYDPADFLHFRGQGYHQIGETMARSLWQACFRAAAKSQPTRITAATASGTSVVLTYACPTPPLVIDATSVVAKAQSGFAFTDSGGEKAISAVTVTGPTQITLTLATATTGSGMRVYYGTRPHVTTRTLATVPGGNIRDSSGEAWKSSLDGQRHDFWALAQYIDL